MKVRRLAGTAAAAAIAGASLIYLGSAAQAATTVPAQLSLTGVTTASSPLGGTTVGLHPGDTLQLSASTAPTAGLTSLGLPGAGLVSSLAGYEVIAHFPASFPGGARNLTLGYKASTLINFPNAGTYPFTWNAYQLTPTLLGGVVATKISLTSVLTPSQIQQAHIGINAQGQWVGQVVVSDNPPAGGLGVQLPSTSISPSLPVGGLPSVQLPGVTTPTLPGAPKLPGIPGTGTGGTNPGPQPGSSGGSQLNYQPPGANPADGVVPKGYGPGSGASYQYVAPGLGSAGGSSVVGGNSGSGSGGSSAANGKAARASSGAVPSRSRSVDLASSSDHGIAALPSLLVIAAVLALSGATALYARTFLLRPRAAQVPVRR